MPEPSSFFWYHDHRMDHTSRNNWMGLQGMFIVDDAHATTRGLRLPGSRRDVPLMISDRSFTAHNQLTHVHEPTMTMGHGMRFMGQYAPPNDANVGTRMLVDGRYAPHLSTTATHYRLRLLNSSASSAYDVELSDGRPFVQIGTGDGLLPHPVVRQSILLGPAQRADVVVDFHGESGQDVVLQTVARTDADAAVGTGSRIGPLMQFRVRGTAKDDTHIPESLPSPARIRIPHAVAKRWTFSLGGNRRSGTFWAINGKAFDPTRVDHTVRLGTTEKWVLRNTSDVTHYVHIHEEQWHTVSRDGRRPPPWERGLEDTWRLDPGEVVVVAARFTDYTGRFMIHCHMLDHEDHGMMAYYEVVA
jgi:FtsP/CotA-like multicopper oxidase with cupredoxin domain